MAKKKKTLQALANIHSEDSLLEDISRINQSVAYCLRRQKETGLDFWARVAGYHAKHRDSRKALIKKLKRFWE